MTRTINLLLTTLFLTAVSVNGNVLLVTNNNSDGTGSLDQAVTEANHSVGEDTILFAADVRGTINNNTTLSLTEGLTMIGPGPDILTITSGGNGRVILIDDVYDATFNFIGLTISGGNNSTGPGAGIFASTQYINILNCVIKENVVTYQNSGGGGLWIRAWYTVIANSLIENNTSQISAGGMFINSDGTIKNTSFINNTVTNVNPHWGGGAIYNVTGTLILENCTFSGNVHPLAGGAIYNTLYGQLKFHNCTIVNNQSETGGGIANFSSSSEDTMITLCHTIVGNNSGASGNDLYGIFRSYGYNCIEDTDSSTISGDETGNMYGEDPGFGDLTVYSPTVQAHPPLAGSPVIDAGDNFTCLHNDQRGIERPQDGDGDGEAIADIGAFEAMVDNDEDGVSDAAEQGPGGHDITYDGNGDSVPDYTQSNVTSLWNYDDSVYVTVAAPEGVKLLNVFAVEDPSGGNLPADISFPVGFFKFMLDLHGIGPDVSVMMYFPAGISVTNYYKYGSTSELTMPHWYLFDYDSDTGAEIIYPNQINLHFTDGERGDDDLTVNNRIIDAGGPVGRGTAIENAPLVVDEFQLVQNYPNPFNPVTTIKYGLPKKSPVQLIIFDLLGREVWKYTKDMQPAGWHSVQWNGRDGFGHHVSTGVYFYRLVAGEFVETRKMVFMK